MRLPFVDQSGCCRVCGRALQAFCGEFVCEDCRKTRPFFDACASALRFENSARRMIHDFKYRRHLWLRDDFTDWLEAAVRARLDVAAVDAVIPMPVTPWHRLERGYNQSAYLAAALSRRLDRMLREGCVVRKGNPKRQAGLDEETRRKNVVGTFRCQHPEFVRGRNVLVVDDVMTTGATLSECAKELKLAGAARVWCVTLARSTRD